MTVWGHRADARLPGESFHPPSLLALWVLSLLLSWDGGSEGPKGMRERKWGRMTVGGDL